MKEKDARSSSPTIISGELQFGRPSGVDRSVTLPTFLAVVLGVGTAAMVVVAAGRVVGLDPVPPSP